MVIMRLIKYELMNCEEAIKASEALKGFKNAVLGSAIVVSISQPRLQNEVTNIMYDFGAYASDLTEFDELFLKEAA